MIGADLARAVLFAGLVFVRSADQIWLAFVLVTLGVIATAFFEPARTAMLPDVVPRESLDHGQRPVGGDVGGDAGRRRIGGRRHHGARRARRGLHLQRPVVSRLGRCAAGPARRRNAPVTASLEGTRLRVRDGIDYLRQHPATLALLSIKGVWAVAGGMMLLLTVFGQRVFASSPGETAARGIGVLFAARGVGAIGGALLARAVQRLDARRLRGLVPWCYGLAALGYLSLANAPTLAIGAISVVWAHIFGTCSGCSARCCCSLPWRRASAAASSPWNWRCTRSSRRRRSCSRASAWTVCTSHRARSRPASAPSSCCPPWSGASR